MSNNDPVDPQSRNQKMRYWQAMRHYHRYYPYVVPSETCISQDWMMKVLLPVFKAAEEHNDDAFLHFEEDDMDEDESLLDYINNCVRDAYEEGEVNPHPLQTIWRFTHVTPVDNLKVIILGQDPDCTETESNSRPNGLAFSSYPGGNVGSGLRVIFQAIKAQLGYQPAMNGDLSRWAAQGVLLLNSISTCGSFHGSHEDYGWLELNQMILYSLSDYYEYYLNRQLFVMAWGKYGQMIAQTNMFDDSVEEDIQLWLHRLHRVNRFDRLDELDYRDEAVTHWYHKLVLSAHPSSYSSQRGNFANNRHFCDFREFARARNMQEVSWA